MGFFGVLRAAEIQTGEEELQVKACHINLWSLDGLLGRRLLFLDVGIRLRTKTGKPTCLSVALPGHVPDSPNDLSSLLGDDEIRTLIFARSVPFASGEMTLSDEKIEILPIDMARTKSEVITEEFSLWHIQFPQVVSSDHDSYVRIRFRLLRSEKLWEWYKCAFVRNRVVVDFRLADARGVTSVPNSNALIRRLLSVQRLNLFVIAPFWLRMRFASPNLEYTRLYEGAVWEKYLERATSLWRSDKLVIYQWEARDVGPQKPYRAFLELGKEPDVISLGNHVRAALTLIGVVIIILYTWNHSEPLVDYVKANIGVAVGAVLGMVSLSVILKILGNIRILRGICQWSTKRFINIENWIYKRFRR